MCSPRRSRFPQVLAMRPAQEAAPVHGAAARPRRGGSPGGDQIRRQREGGASWWARPRGRRQCRRQRHRRALRLDARRGRDDPERGPRAWSQVGASRRQVAGEDRACNSESVPPAHLARIQRHGWPRLCFLRSLQRTGCQGRGATPHQKDETQTRGSGETPRDRTISQRCQERECDSLESASAETP